MEEILRELEVLKRKHELFRGTQKGIGCHFWNGRAEGVQDAIEAIKKAACTSTASTNVGQITLAPPHTSPPAV
jgi:hypothetical protein